MGKHQLDGGMEVEVTAVNATLGSSPPRIEGSGRDRVLSFSKPTDALPLVNIHFKFKATGNTSAFMFGIKQICTPTDYQALYAGLKDIDGSISMESPGFDNNRFLDISPTVLRVLFDANNFSTGAIASAPHAPFFSEAPATVRAGTEIELSIVDHPGNNTRLELQNGATDRPNFLDRVTKSEDFLTALVVVRFDAGRVISHTPVEAVRWRVKSFARIAWSGNDASIQGPLHQATKVADLPTISAGSELDILRDMSLTTADCLVQKYNDALFSAKGQFERQNFSRPTGQLTTISSRGVRYIQFPVIAN